MDFPAASTNQASGFPGAGHNPLTGHTVLLVEDSRYASEAMRLMCQYSGGRLRRADTLRAAYRHLAVYRPDAVIVDLGLPDGSGLELIRDLDRSHQRPGRVIATSGMNDMGAAALEAGADAFLAKPIDSLAAFQDAFRATDDPMPPGTATRPDGSAFRLRPDRLALRDDLHMAADLLTGRQTPETLQYTTQFIDSIAVSLQDEALQKAINATRHTGQLGQLPDLLRRRLKAEAEM
ncbi:response regulator [Roseicitreum antarcticum]|uniref:Response regulator receiver domain-containing protein n=1 Tax=Roseicitreum antarcticum TaxID=564137 RepID=A0A1H2XZY5_9RHOB|nr:response regulator [Roseicitreum antarcticum]SDW97984.1 Response regulator receiver domain-containing protein [Roseicitreum antarcticum]